ncbi:MAG TPA: outer membrane beta-barrel protein [Thermoanaerobaculia bacterium]|nr:outer membrane beta-barrel protein [Thermoanaerobaculia bacterium]
MRKYSLFILLLLLSTTSLFAQDWRRARRTPYEDRFELTPFVGYRWGGTIFADQTFVFTQDLDVKNSANLGINLGIPLGQSGMKLELMANHQSSELETDRGLFEPTAGIADIDVTYLHAGLQIPFARSRNLTPYVIASAGITNLDPQLGGVSDETRFSASAGIGIKAPISNNLSFRFEGRGYYTALEDESDCRICDYYYNRDFYQGEVNLGLVFSF